MDGMEKLLWLTCRAEGDPGRDLRRGGARLGGGVRAGGAGGRPRRIRCGSEAQGQGQGQGGRVLGGMGWVRCSRVRVDADCELRLRVQVLPGLQGVGSCLLPHDFPNECFRWHFP